jgi:glucose dehydrogenase
MAYSPQTGLFYVPANEWGMDIWNEPDEQEPDRRRCRAGRAG